MDTASCERVHRYNIDNIDLSLSPMRTDPRCFRSGILFDTSTFQRIQANVHASPSTLNKSMANEEQESDGDTTTGSDQDLNAILRAARTTDLEHLLQLIQRAQPAGTNEIADLLMELIGNVPAESTTAGTVYVHVPLNQTGTVADRDRLYADYGHLDRQTLAQEFQFNLQNRHHRRHRNNHN